MNYAYVDADGTMNLGNRDDGVQIGGEHDLTQDSRVAYSSGAGISVGDFSR